MWKSNISGDDNDDDGGAFVHLINENSSWHGHTMLAVEYRNGDGPHTYWGLSFQPANEGEALAELLVTGVKAQLVTRTGWGQQDPGTQGATSSRTLSYPITSAQASTLKNVIDQEKIWINNGTVTYATLGRPITGMWMSGYRDTCYSWAVRVLRQAGIVADYWQAARWFSFAPTTADLFGAEKKA